MSIQIAIAILFTYMFFRGLVESVVWPIRGKESSYHIWRLIESLMVFIFYYGLVGDLVKAIGWWLIGLFIYFRGQAYPGLLNGGGDYQMPWFAINYSREDRLALELIVFGIGFMIILITLGG